MSEHCLFCGGVVDAQGGCATCGVARVSRDERRIGAPCPRCENVRLGPFELGPVVVQGCSRCRGMFLAASEWDALLDSSYDGAFSNASPYRGVMPDDAPPTDLAPRISCPVCRTTMERVEFARVSHIDVDVCEPHGLWLDAGELGRVIARVGTHAVAGTEAAAYAAARREPHASAAPLFVDAFIDVLKAFLRAR